ncbi:uncharacterized protein LOC128400714 [Podarcis raffonei]|uniref:uncharacterized protein LOC128400714 n=1 Tax=Podarcis raffonei TaxID=65483 RepID=UPI0023290F07|nr:uncharacterized protein LOC128400714 [Podarcis raffonei]
MSSKHSSCQEVGDLAIKFLGGLVLLCVANNVIALLCLPPPPFSSKEVPRSKRKREKQEAKEALEPTSSREGGRPQSARSTHRASSRPETHRHSSSRAALDGGGGGSSGVSRRGSRRDGTDGKRPEPSSSARRREQQQQQQPEELEAASGRHRRSRQQVLSRSPSPRERRLRAPCPSKILILRTDSKGEVPKGSCGGAPRGQVVYDARWLPCVLGEGGQATLLPQQLRELCSQTPPVRRPGGASPARVSKEVAQ